MVESIYNADGFNIAVVSKRPKRRLNKDPKYCCINCYEITENKEERMCSCIKCAQRKCNTCFEFCWRVHQIKNGKISRQNI